MNNSVFEKTMEIVRKRRDIKLVRTERRRNYLLFRNKLSYCKIFKEKLLAIEMKKNRDTYE